MIFNRDDIDASILLILDKLEEDDRVEVQNYILNIVEEMDSIQCDLNSTEEDLRDTQEELDNAQYELEQKCNYCDFNYVMNEIVNDQRYYTKSYDTKEKILDKLEHTLRYGDKNRIWM